MKFKWLLWLFTFSVDLDANFRSPTKENQQWFYLQGKGLLKHCVTYFNTFFINAGLTACIYILQLKPLQKSVTWSNANSTVTVNRDMSLDLLYSVFEPWNFKFPVHSLKWCQPVLQKRGNLCSQAVQIIFAFKLSQ